MQRSATIILQALLVLVGIGTLVFMLWEPHVEGRNVGATPFEVYFQDPFLAYAYAASAAFFTALYQGFKLLGYFRNGRAFSTDSVKAVRTIRTCATVLIGCIAAAQVYLFVLVRGKDDIAGGVAVSLLLMLVAVAMAAAASVLEGLLRARR